VTAESAVRPLRLENRHTGELLELLRRRVDGETVLEIRGKLPPRRQGPPLHVHHREDEEGEVLAGTLSVELGGRRFTAAAGERVRLPRGVPHRWWNDGDAPLAFVGFARPVVDLDRFLQAVFEIVDAGPPGRPPLVYLAHAAWRHRRTQLVVGVPRRLQPIFLGAVVAAGTLLGRYRGTRWPGCPARCAGAPEA